MIVIKPLVDKIKSMAETVGLETLNGLDHHYYERGIVDSVFAGESISVGEAVEAVTFLRGEINGGASNRSR